MNQNLVLFALPVVVATALAEESVAPPPPPDDDDGLRAQLAADGTMVLDSTATFFGDTVVRVAAFIGIFLVVIFCVYIVPRIADFFLVLCRVPRHYRYQVAMLLKATVLVTGTLFALALVGINANALALVSSVFSFAIVTVFESPLRKFVAGFWIQSGTDFEPGKRLRVGAYYGTIIELDSLFVRMRLMPSSSAAVDGDDAAPPPLRDTADDPDSGVDEFGRSYSDKIVSIPNDQLLETAHINYRDHVLEKSTAAAAVEPVRAAAAAAPLSSRAQENLRRRFAAPP